MDSAQKVIDAIGPYAEGQGDHIADLLERVTGVEGDVEVMTGLAEGTAQRSEGSAELFFSIAFLLGYALAQWEAAQDA